jgi:hypothetical protein
MIKYEKLDTGTPPDIKCITDDGNAELAALEEIFNNPDLDFADDDPVKVNYETQAKQPGPDGNFEFVIPGEHAGEFAEVIYDIDDGALDELTDKLNQEALDRSYDE